MDEFGRYPSGNKVTEEPEVLFARLKLDDVMKKVKVIQEEQKKAVAAKAEPEKEEDEKAEASISSRKQRLPTMILQNCSSRLA